MCKVQVFFRQKNTDRPLASTSSSQLFRWFPWPLSEHFTSCHRPPRRGWSWLELLPVI